MIRKRAGTRTGRILFRPTLPRSDSPHRRPSARGSLDKGSRGREEPHPALSPSAAHTRAPTHTRSGNTRTRAHVHPQAASLWDKDKALEEPRGTP